MLSHGYIFQYLIVANDMWVIQASHNPSLPDKPIVEYKFITKKALKIKTNKTSNNRVYVLQTYVLVNLLKDFFFIIILFNKNLL